MFPNELLKNKNQTKETNNLTSHPTIYHESNHDCNDSGFSMEISGSPEFAGNVVKRVCRYTLGFRV